MTTASTERAIRELYRVFAPYRISSHPTGCPCCVRAGDAAVLFSRPLERLTADDLWRFSRKVLTTWGDDRDLKHFLPRMLELLVEDFGTPCDIGVVLGKLRLAEWPTWPAVERAAVDGFIQAVWVLCLRDERAVCSVAEWLCAFGCAGCGMEPFLSEWENCRWGPGYSGLRDFIDSETRPLIRHRSLGNGFWGDAPEARSVVAGWLLSPATVARLTMIFEETLTSDYSDELALLIDRLTLLQRSIDQ